jgi:hypothetical protein
MTNPSVISFVLSNRVLLAQARAILDAGVETSFPADVDALAAAAKAAGIAVVHKSFCGISCETTAQEFERLVGFRADLQKGYSGPCQLHASGCEELDFLEVYPRLDPY